MPRKLVLHYKPDELRARAAKFDLSDDLLAALTGLPLAAIHDAFDGRTAIPLPMRAMVALYTSVTAQVRARVAESAAKALPAFAEEWRSIPGTRNYEASSGGSIRLRGSRPLKATRTRSGHQNVTVYRTDGAQWRAGVHNLVARAFLGPPPTDKPYACHRDGRAHRNTPDNLYWGSHADNVRDMVRHARERPKTWKIGGRDHIPQQTQ